MELIQLKYFKRAAELQHISKAAEELHIPQPYLSQTIKRLEQELSTQLFDRVGKRIVLNNAGKILLKYAEQVLMSVCNAELELKSAFEPEIQEIGVLFQSASMLIPQLMKEIMKDNPGLNFTIYQKIRDLSPADVDITIYSSDRATPGAHESLLLKEELMVVLPEAHPLSRTIEIDLADLRQEKFISLSKESNLYNILSGCYERMNFKPQTCFHIDNPSVMRDMLINGFGISIVPSITWRDLLQKHMVLRPIRNFRMERFLYLAWNTQKYQTSAVKACILQIINFFRELESSSFGL